MPAMNITGDSSYMNSRPPFFDMSYSYTTTQWPQGIQPQVYMPQGPSYDTSQQEPGQPSNFIPLDTNFSFYSNHGTMSSPMNFPIRSTVSFNECIPLRCKRKTESPPPVHVKQHITEERMAEHLSKLHISTENPAPTSEPESSAIREKRLYMCEEMRKLQTDSIIPVSLLEKMSGTCKAVVLWTPPRLLGIASQEQPDNDNNNNENNNEEEVPDQNLMDLDR